MAVFIITLTFIIAQYIAIYYKFSAIASLIKFFSSFLPFFLFYKIFYEPYDASGCIFIILLHNIKN